PPFPRASVEHRVPCAQLFRPGRLHNSPEPRPWDLARGCADLEDFQETRQGPAPDKSGSHAHGPAPSTDTPWHEAVPDYRVHSWRAANCLPAQYEERRY